MGRNLFAIFVVFGLSLTLPGNDAASRPIKIGAIFHDGDEEHKAAFLKAVYETKFEHGAPAFELKTTIRQVEVNTDSFKTAAAACELIGEGVAAIFGPSSHHTHGIVASIAARFDIPHIDYFWRQNEELPADQEENNRTPMTVNVFPDSDLVGKMIADVVESMKWSSFAAVYQNNDGLSRLRQALTLRRSKDSVVTIKRIGEGPDFRGVLKDIRNMSISNVIVDVEPHQIMDVLYQAKEVKLLADYSNFFITYLDSTKLPLSDVRNHANLTGLSLRENDVDGINWVESAVLYDAVFLFYNALETLNARNKDCEEPVTIDPVPLSCADTEKYNAGPNITNLIRELSRQGKITGPITFNENGYRQDINVAIMDVKDDGSAKIGYWDVEGLHQIGSEEEREAGVYKDIEQKDFKISTKVGPPYVMEVTDSATRGILIDQTRYEGFCIDLIDEIAKLLSFKSYEFELVPDGNYGSYNKDTKQWNGLMRRLLDHKADLAICDLTITYERESAVDFTMPFMNLGISILFGKPEEKDPDLFSFLSPLSTDVWIYMATAFLAVSVMLFLQARMAPGEWNNPHPCNPDPEELENNFTLNNSMWLTVGSVMQQGSDILPAAPSVRMVAGMWWFFTLIMISSYTANLAAFLTVEKSGTPIKGVEDLAKQTKIKYGSVDGGSTSAFFRDSNYSTYQRMYTAMMEARPSVFTKTNDEGVERVAKKRDYAFLMESTTIEYRMERNCQLTKVGGLIDNKGYGIALPRNSPYRTPISGAILSLQEKGVLQDLKKKWWVERGGGKCKDSDVEAASSGELALANVGGVFLVLIFGCCGSFVLAIFEFLWNVRKVAVSEKVTPWEAMVAELKFAMNIWAETKPVKISKSSGTSSMEGGIGRAASTARSIVGSFLRLDMLDKFDKDNNTNDRSNDRKVN
ncbi:glutamate receptor ionotropic, kainate 2 [Lasioglossum baleicum]|uniref:glutamate receptor ionotropic, kainate 2 n=1 Tax=Lasioglossum baleicum TaxID=434251 RepID=UPI003FCE3A13